MSDLCTVEVPRETLATVAGLLDEAELLSDPDRMDPETAALWEIISILTEPLGLKYDGTTGTWQALP